MDKYADLLESFVSRSENILGENLVGVYLHGSAVMGCFHEKKSDIDLLVVVAEGIPDHIKRRYMDMVVDLNRNAPAKGIELSILREQVCKPFVYPTPFEIHFSVAHLNWYLSAPDDYIRRMKGNDKDLAAHVTVLYHRGRTLYGKAFRDVFSSVSRADYFDSIWCDVENAEEDIISDPMYVILNLCRVLAYRTDNLILSKQEGGQWGMENVPDPRYQKLIGDALRAYQTGEPVTVDEVLARKFAKFMVSRIRE